MSFFDTRKLQGIPPRNLSAGDRLRILNQMEDLADKLWARLPLRAEQVGRSDPLFAISPENGAYGVSGTPGRWTVVYAEDGVEASRDFDDLEDCIRHAETMNRGE